MAVLRVFRLWLLWIVALALVLAVLLGGPLGFWGDGSRGDGGRGPGTDGGSQGADGAGSVDRSLGRCTAVEEALAHGRPGRAWSLLEAGEQAGIPAAVQERWSQARARAKTALDRSIERLVQDVRSGRILAAGSLLAGLTGEASRTVAQRLDALARGRGWPLRSGRVQGATPEGEIAPAGRELARHRRVRVAHRGRLVDAPVWRVDGEAVTVRLQDPGGVAFPVFDRAVVEPVDPSFEEAAAQVRICLRAGEIMAARLWLCHCLERPGASQHQEELVALRQLLR